MVVRAQLGNEVAGILGRIHSQNLGDDQQRVSKSLDSQLLVGFESCSKFAEMDRQSRLNAAATDDLHTRESRGVERQHTSVFDSRTLLTIQRAS